MSRHRRLRLMSGVEVDEPPRDADSRAATPGEERDHCRHEVVRRAVGPHLIAHVYEVALREQVLVVEVLLAPRLTGVPLRGVEEAHRVGASENLGEEPGVPRRESGS